MPTSLNRLFTIFRLLGGGALIKLSVLLFCIGSAAYADANQPCPVLAVKAGCTAQGTAALTLRAAKDAPPGLSYLVSLPDEKIGAISLAPGASVTVDLPFATGQQVKLAVVGLELQVGDLAACCLSNQRVHLPAACAPAAPDLTPDPADTPDDLAVDLKLSPECTRTRASPVCSGTLAVTGAGAGLAPVTLAAKLGQALVATGAECSAFANGQALCRLPVGRPLPFDLALSPTAPRGTATLCADLGIGADETARTLALQDALLRAGYAVGKVDGAFGPATLAALAEFMADAGLPPLSAEIPPEALFLLGIGDYQDAVPGNNRACADTNVPPAPLVCDAATTRNNGDTCACRFKGMTRISAVACTCKKGTKLGAKGCEVIRKDTTSTTDTTLTDANPACDPATTVLRGGVCECRSAAMERVNATSCTTPEVRYCPDGSPEVPGIPCPPEGAGCKRFNEAGECCDDLEPGDLSCR